MKNRLGIFITLVIVMSVMASLLGVVVFRSSQKDADSVREEDRQYTANKLAQNTPEQSVDSGSDLATQQAEQLKKARLVSVYFSKTPESDTQPEKVFALERYVSENSAESSTVRQLIEGPSDTEEASGFFGGLALTGNSNCGDEDFSLKKENGTITLQLCREHVSEGPLQDSQEAHQLYSTLKQFSGVNQVQILDSQGNCLYSNPDIAVCSQ